MIIQFLFPDQPVDLEIELVDNPAVASWARHFATRGFQGHANLQDHNRRWQYDATVISFHLTQCEMVLAELARWGYRWEYAWPQQQEITRDMLNRLHRYFTYYQDQVNRVQWTDRPVDQALEKKRLITHLLQQVNDHVHAIERYLLPVPDVSGFDLQEIYVGDDLPYDDQHWWTMAPDDRQYHSDQHADVIFGSQILGKTLLRSYLDGDDPNDHDTTGHYCNNCALQILPTRSREQIYQSEDFNRWLAQHGLDRSRAWFDFPVGRVVNHDLLQQLIDLFNQHDNLVDVRYQFD